MAFPLDISFPTPLRRGSLSPKKRFQNTVKRLKRTVRANTKAARRQYKQAMSRHYFVPAATRDLRAAARQNEDIVIAAVAFAVIMTYACATIASPFILALSRATYLMTEENGLDIAVMFVAVLGVVGLFCSLIAAAAMSFMSLAIMDGANRKVNKSIRSTFRRSLKLANRITNAWFLVGMINFVRLLAVIIPVILYVKWFSNIGVISKEFLLAVAAAGSVWLIAGLLRYSMIPYVSLFEPKCLPADSLLRSRQLVNNQARVFLVTGTAIFAIYSLAVYKLCEALKQWLGLGSNILFIVCLLAGLIMANGAMVMLYRKRKLARS